MGLLDKFKKNKKNHENDSEEMIEFEKQDMTGWDAITEAFEKIYPEQTDPKHYGVLIPWELGGNDPLTGISIYETDDYYHFVTYGLSEIYGKETDDPEISGYGMEFTMKLKKSSIDKKNEEGELRCVCGTLQKVARITFEHGELFNANEYIYTGQTAGIDCGQSSTLTGFILVADPSVGSIDTKNGRVDFVEFIGCTDDELVAVKDKRMTVEELYSAIGSDVTDYKRCSVL